MTVTVLRRRPHGGRAIVPLLARWFGRGQPRTGLERLDARLLRDIGLTPADVADLTR